ncbi:superoxide dismutase [Phenylobacterium sp.]|uniref:superoxide dismutase n=1 Tax=Phenylobacterium sp. TaxID=1871053 RepID=UPI00301D042E
MLTLPPLPYGYAALSPVISEATLRTHHGKHHARYVQVANELLAARGDRPETLEEIVVEADRANDRKLFNNAAQAWNHGFFWMCMRPGGSRPEGGLAEAIDQAFGSLAGLRDAFIAEGAGRFGSGWVWLLAKGGALSVVSTHDAATPLTAAGATPLLVCDVWEHAYYLDHSNDRAAFLSAWWDHCIDWAFVAAQFEAAATGAAGWRYPAPTLASAS